MLFLQFFAIFVCVFGDSVDYSEYEDEEEYFIKSGDEFYIPQNESQIPLKFSDILKFDRNLPMLTPTTTLPSVPLLYRYNHQYHQRQIPFYICASSCLIDSTLSIFYYTKDTVEESTNKGYCRIDITFTNNYFLIKTNFPENTAEINQTILENDKCYLFKFDIRANNVQIQASDKQNLKKFQTCSFKTFQENEPSKYSQILLKAKISDQRCLYKIWMTGMGNFTFRKPPKSTLPPPSTLITTKKSTTKIITSKKSIHGTTQKSSAEATIHIANVILYCIAGGVGISIIVFIIACLFSRRKRNKKEKLQKALTPKKPSMELDSTQTMPVKSSSEQLQVTQQLPPPKTQISQPLQTAKLIKRKSQKSNRVSKLSSNFQHLPSKSQSRQKVVTLSLNNQNAKKKAPKGTKNEKKDSYGNTTISANQSKKALNQLKTASTLDRY